VHGKQAIVEPTRKLTADEVRERVCRTYPTNMKTWND
jgi:hypothetical protein